MEPKILKALTDLKIIDLIKESGIDPKQAYDNLYEVGMIDEDEDDMSHIVEKSNCEFVNSRSEFEHVVENDLLDKENILKSVIDNISLLYFKCEDKHEYILDAYYKHYNILPTKLISDENRQFVFDYLIKTNKTNSITFGLNQKWDIENLHSLPDSINGLDFANWADDPFSSVYDDPDNYVILAEQILKMLDKNDDNIWYDNYLKVLSIFILNLNGFEYLLENIDRDHYSCLYDFIFTMDSTSNDIRIELKSQKIGFGFMSYIIENFTYGTNALCPAQYINTQSFIDYVVATNKDDFKYGKNILDSHGQEFMRLCTSIEDVVYLNEYINNINFTMRPMLIKFSDFYDRYANTGDFNARHLISVEITKYERNNLFFFMMELPEDKVNEILANDPYFCFELDEIKYSQKVELLRKYPQLIGYFVE